MAAAYSARRRGVTAYRTTKGLFFISTLLCLICFTYSLIDKDWLEKSKVNFEKLKQILDNLKAKPTMSSEMRDVYMTLMDQMTDLIKETKNSLPEDFPPLDTFMDSLKAYMLKNIAKLDSENEELDRKMKKTEENLDRLQKLLDILADQKTEL